MKRFTQFSIGTLLLLTLVAAVTVRFWPESEPTEPIDWEIEEKSTYVWYDDARGIIKQSYDGTWERNWAIPGTGSCLSLFYGTHIVGSFDGNAYKNIQIHSRNRTGICSRAV